MFYFIIYWCNYDLEITDESAGNIAKNVECTVHMHGKFTDQERFGNLIVRYLN
jgi:predicted urease superfamily metal-dependent hydrolase